MKSLCCLLVFLSCIHSIVGIKCLSCTYTFAGAHGTYDRECVSDVYNFTKTREIECSQFCMTKAVYQSGYHRLNSLYRGCGYKREKYCNSPHYLVPNCELSCTHDLCNDGNGDLWQRMKPHPHPHPHPGGRGGASSSLGQSWTSRVLSLVVTPGLWLLVLFGNKMLT